MTKEKRAAAVPKNWQNRIVGYAEESPDQLLANPQNWRVHSKNQQIALSGVLDDIGFIAPVIVNQLTGHLVDGHLRVSLALRHEIPTIPVVYVNISEQEEKEALSTFDPITNMASSDMKMLEGLIKDLDKVNDATKLLLGSVVHEANKKAVKDILDPMMGYEGTEAAPDMGTLSTMLPRSAANLEMTEDEDEMDFDGDSLSSVFSNLYDENDAALLTEKKQYPSMYTDNEWGVPTLNLDYQMIKVPVLVERWGRIARHNTRMPGLWHFYTEDYKFSGVWKNPDSVVKSGCTAAIEPNFSTGENFAKAEVLYNIWQKRWLAAYWQTRGIRICVDLNVEFKFRDICLLGVPEGWRSYALRIHDVDDMEEIYEMERMAKDRAAGEDLVFLVFATKTKGVEQLCKERGWINCKMDAHVKSDVL